MISLALAWVIALVGMAMLLRRAPQESSTDRLTSALPFALMLPVMPLGPAGLSFIRAFEEVASIDHGGTRFIAGICLASSRPHYYGLLGMLLLILLAATCHVVRRNRPATRPGRPVWSMPGWVLTITSWMLALMTGFLCHQARQLAYLTVFVMDPGKNAEAEVVFQGMNLSDVSALIATKTILVTVGGLGLSLLLLGAGVFNLLVTGPSFPARGTRIGTWCLYLAVLALGGLQAYWVGEDLRYFESVLHRE